MLLVTDDRALQRSIARARSAQGLRPVAAALSSRIEQSIERLRPLAIVLDVDHLTPEAWCEIGRLRGAALTPPLSTVAERRDARDVMAQHGVTPDAHLAKPLLLAELLVAMGIREAEP